jgi:hypothetical protein
MLLIRRVNFPDFPGFVFTRRTMVGGRQNRLGMVIAKKSSLIPPVGISADLQQGYFSIPSGKPVNHPNGSTGSASAGLEPAVSAPSRGGI